MNRFACILLFAALACAQKTEELQPTGLDLFLLVGQSNMAGRGAIEAADAEPIARVYALGQDLHWKLASDPLHSDKPTAGVGLGRSFAKWLLRVEPGASIGLIPAAVGGTSLEEWKPGGKLFNDAVMRAGVARKSGRFRGILWHQGEADTKDDALARSYRERFAVFIAALRKEVGDPNVPVVVGQLGEFFKGQKIVNEQLASIPLTVPHAGFASSAGLRHKGDEVHFDSPSLRELGRRYALAFEALDPSWGSSHP